MTYEDPKTNRERNLGQDDVGSSTGSWIGGLVLVAAIALGGWYFYHRNETSADMSKPTSSTAAENSTGTSTPPSSGPGVQGAAGSTNGPAVKAPENGSATGASSGTSGNIDPGTQPSQDATGVQGATGGKNGPAENSPKQ